MNDFILASQSPRRSQLLKQIGIDFKVEIPDVDESFPLDIAPIKVPEYLAELKATKIVNTFADSIIIAADTIVLLNNEILGKPQNEEHAFEMLSKLSNNMHQVITGVCIKKGTNTILFSEITEVYFKKLTTEQIKYYITNYKPFDKAGSYAIQEWIGMIAIKKINGDYYNVMGLPLCTLMTHLETFL